MEILKDAKPTYKTRENAVNKVTKRFGNAEGIAINPLTSAPLRYIIAVNAEGRFFPVLIGSDSINLVHAGFAVAA